jgi:hypothetical protein
MLQDRDRVEDDSCKTPTSPQISPKKNETIVDRRVSLLLRFALQFAHLAMPGRKQNGNGAATHPKPSRLQWECADERREMPATRIEQLSGLRGPAPGTLIRTRRLILAAIRVWELKHGIRD